MALLSELALTPGVLDGSLYPDEQLASHLLYPLRDALLSDAVARNLRDGSWLNEFDDSGRPWLRHGKELLRKLVKQNRLLPFPAALSETPESDDDWCREAVASHERLPLDCVVTAPGQAPCVDDPVVAPIDRLRGTAWWLRRGESVRLGRTTTDYLTHLSLVLDHARSIQLIDPHLDPSEPRYSGVLQLIRRVCRRSYCPIVEVHRVCYVGPPRNRTIIQPEEWAGRFRQAWGSDLQQANQKVHLYIWDDFHDRYLLSDLVGLLIPNGFDVTRAVQRTTWTRLSRRDRDDVQREFDRASTAHGLRCGDGPLEIP